MQADVGRGNLNDRKRISIHLPCLPQFLKISLIYFIIMLLYRGLVPVFFRDRGHKQCAVIGESNKRINMAISPLPKIIVDFEAISFNEGNSLEPDYLFFPIQFFD